ncbi:hypothetical protein DFJ73DRAFT_19868 [Zopfochytrium polystomum]|nr:hypothetical protein DFJ73DRAFT_19868 [Zopfochytrium polystomum]
MIFDFSAGEGEEEGTVQEGGDRGGGEREEAGRLGRLGREVEGENGGEEEDRGRGAVLGERREGGRLLQCCTSYLTASKGKFEARRLVAVTGGGDGIVCACKGVCMLCACVCVRVCVCVCVWVCVCGWCVCVCVGTGGKEGAGGTRKTKKGRGREAERGPRKTMPARRRASRPDGHLSHESPMMMMMMMMLVNDRSSHTSGPTSSRFSKHQSSNIQYETRSGCCAWWEWLSSNPVVANFRLTPFSFFSVFLSFFRPSSPC